MLFIYGTVYNSRNRILQSLDSVMKINIEKRIFIIDNYSTDGTYEILRDNGDKYNLMVKQEKCTRGWGRHLAIDMAEQYATEEDIFFFIDLDTVYNQEFVRLIEFGYKNIDKNTVFLDNHLCYYEADFINAGVYISLLFKSYKMLGETGKIEKIEPFATLVLYSFPIFFSSIMTTSGTYIDRIIVSYFINLSYLGIYNYALVIASVAAVLTMPISNLLIPKLSEYFSLDDRTGFRNTVRMLLNISSLIYIPGAMGIAAISRITLYIFAGPSYVIAYVPLIIIMFVTSLFIGTVILASAVKSVQKSRVFVFSSGAALLSNIILSIILIPHYNIIGAGIAYSSMTTVNFIIIYTYARKLGISNYDMHTVLKIWAASVMLFIIIFGVQFLVPYNIYSEVLLIILGIGIYLFEIKYMKLIGTEERKFIISVVPSRFTVLHRLINKL